MTGDDLGPALSTAEARSYIGNVRWQFAKTMPDWPHEYTIKAWRPELSARFEGALPAHRDRPFRGPWPPPLATAIYHNRYLMIDDHKYWAIGPLGDSDPI